MTVTETMVERACAAFYAGWANAFSSTKVKEKKKMRAALTAALSDMVVVPVEVIHRFSRHYELNECEKRKPDDALEIPIYDLRDLIAAAPPPSSPVSGGE